MTALQIILIAILGYLLGNFSTGILLSKRMGVDIRQMGSGSSGSTNILRNLGAGPSALTFLGDVAKGFLAAFVGYIIMGRGGAMIGGIAAIVGHNWPVFFGFKGGKGIATTAGAILFVQPLTALILLGLAAIIIIATRIISIASMSCCILYFLYNLIANFGDWPLFFFSLGVMVLALFCHRENIGRLIRREEKPVAFTKKGRGLR